ncbi:MULTISPECIES: GAF and ANTAR domain-containing protein [Cryobacterium]|uniref:Transcriptional regulator n=1 Tax=Cryobacterium zongtaii TaxID=1259217 RepID=A0A2S3ZGX8_9MICO|nr:MULTISPECIES: GAF and ANTAR domain-containing protein [Cryobacterium]POH63667.1 transcriptional regulator [Cryobacterium zongtaii]POH66628.1 transcriptional regulator [Cryobacterium zongtaii]TFC40799.1 ANTAR domain-containing protein [Cryobacterium sp. TMN-39-2]TFC54724.1 ANTAR domain-containing protein [Cryobacterium sp. TMB3-1-2]TFC58257.1 ANTAR domain-containing protein [Cryobacterium sp. TMB1-7]
MHAIDHAADNTREERINDAFVRVAGSLVADYDIVDLLSTLVYTCTQLLDVQAGGILLADGTGMLELVASTSEEAEIVEVMIVAAGAGPCIDCYQTGAVVSVPDIETDPRDWPRFRRTALDQGFRAAHATPLRLHGEVIGAMNLLSTEAGALSDRDAQLAQALADVATVGILHERSFRQPEVVAAQLHLALDTRILVEQAKGVLAEVRSCTMSEAFDALRDYARTHAVTLRAAAAGVVNRSISAEALVAQAR